MADELTKLNPTKGPLLPGVQVDEHSSLCSLPPNLLFQLTMDPRDTEDRKKVAASTDLQHLRELRNDVQRLFEGEKRRNVPLYAHYIVALNQGAKGMTPPIILFSAELLSSAYDESGLGYLQVPWGKKLIALDGETQLAARHEAKNIDPSTAEKNVAVVVVHGFDKDWARQSFHDLNVLGVRPNAALGIAMDSRDPLTQVARDVEMKVPFFRDRVNKSRRQLKSADTALFTITALRGACITLAEGISGVKYGAKPVSVPGEKIDRVREVAIKWFGALAADIGPAMEDRENKLASAPSVLAALGALGHDLVSIDDRDARAKRQGELIAKLRSVDWRRGKHWEGIAGKYTPKGVFSVGGSKETAYAVYDALADVNSEAFTRVRHSASIAAD